MDYILDNLSYLEEYGTAIKVNAFLQNVENICIDLRPYDKRIFNLRKKVWLANNWYILANINWYIFENINDFYFFNRHKGYVEFERATRFTLTEYMYFHKMPHVFFPNIGSTPIKELKWIEENREQENNSYPDSITNKISRIKVMSCYKKYNMAWLGKINRDFNSRKEILWQFHGQEMINETNEKTPAEAKVYNFETDFVIPCYDEKLAKLIEKRNTPSGPFDYTKNTEELKAIYSRIKEIKGLHLHWC